MECVELRGPQSQVRHQIWSIAHRRVPQHASPTSSKRGRVVRKETEAVCWLPHSALADHRLGNNGITLESMNSMEGILKDRLQ
jgi:hypothetical protein